jgi:hypothetical protein
MLLGNIPSAPKGATMAGIRPEIVIGVDCSDTRRDDGNTAIKELVEEHGHAYYRVRNAGPTILMGFSFLLAWIMLAPLLKKGARIVYIRNHYDCAGMHWLYELPVLHLAWRLRGLKDADELGEWLKGRTVRHVYWLGKVYRRERHGAKLVIIPGTVDPESTHIDRRLLDALGISA